MKVIDVGTPESLSAVLVMICNRSLARLVDSSINRVLKGVPKIDALVQRTHGI